MKQISKRVASLFRRGIVALAAFTFVVDVLLLVQPLYMLQIYDRVLASGSIDTLLFISLIAAAALILLGAIDAIRAMMASRLANRIEVACGAEALVAAMRSPRAGLGDIQPLRDLATLRGFVGGKAILSFLDLPFAPFFIAILYLIHPDLFWLTVLGAAVLVLLTLANQWATRKAGQDAAEAAISAAMSAQSFVRSAESLRAMGMVGKVTEAWGREESRTLRSQDRMNRINATFAGIARTVRLGLQIALLGYGGFLVLAGEMSAGMIFAASLISGRGLQPIDQVIGGWKGLVDARSAWSRLSAAIDAAGDDTRRTSLPVPEGRISIDQLVVFAPNSVSPEPLLKRITAEIAAGECVAVIGPSGAGKSTLVRALIGAVAPRSGAVRIDAADLKQWNSEELGRHVGYLSQDIELLPGTITQNIARFDGNAPDEAVVAAAKAAEVHDLIVSLPGGYNTVLGPAGMQLSGGQRQRIGLARAFFGAPKILILDEPNANLDSEGDMALERAVERARQAKVTVILVTQRRPIAERADKIMVLRNGQIEDFGPRSEVFERQAQRLRVAQGRVLPAQPPHAVIQGRFSANQTAEASIAQPA